MFTDGSVLEDGSAGAAFAIPEFHSLRKSSLPPVSIFTAELTAILMALQHISEVRTPPCEIVICSDSRSALSSIRSDSTSAREDLVLEIGTVEHQLITRGTVVRFQWVPAHVCLSGNDMADRAAKRSQASGIPNPRSETRLSRHLLQAIPTGVEETGRRLSSPGHGQRVARSLPS